MDKYIERELYCDRDKRSYRVRFVVFQLPCFSGFVNMNAKIHRCYGSCNNCVRECKTVLDELQKINQFIQQYPLEEVS